MCAGIPLPAASLLSECSTRSQSYRRSTHGRGCKMFEPPASCKIGASRFCTQRAPQPAAERAPCGRSSNAHTARSHTCSVRSRAHHTRAKFVARGTAHVRAAKRKWLQASRAGSHGQSCAGCGTCCACMLLLLVLVNAGHVLLLRAGRDGRARCAGYALAAFRANALTSPRASPPSRRPCRKVLWTAHPACWRHR